MSNKFIHLIVFSVLIAVIPAGSAIAAQQSLVAVLELRNEAGFTDQEAFYLTDKVRDAASRTLAKSGFLIITRESMEQLLPQGTKLTDCSKATCEIEMGRKLGADYVVAGEILTYAGEYRGNLKAYHCSTGAFLGAQVAAGADLKELEGAIEQSSLKLFGTLFDHAKTLEAGPLLPLNRPAGTPVPEEWQSPAKQVVVVRLMSDPPGALVLTNGEMICRATPCDREIEVGLVQISMQRERYLTRRETVEIKLDTRKISWELSPSFGWLTVQSDPPGLAVTIEGELAGRTPIVKKEMAAGEYNILITDTRYQEQGQHIVLKTGELVTTSFQMTPRQGAIEVSARFYDGNALTGEVYLDGKKIGQAPGMMKALIGRHEMEIRTPRGNWSGPVEVKEKEVVKVEAVIGASLAEPPPEKRGGSPARRKTIGYSLLGVGLGLAAVGGASYLLAGQKHSEYEDADNADDAEAARDAGRLYENIGMGAIGLGVVSTGVGIYFLSASPRGGVDNQPDNHLLAGAATDGKRHTLLFGWRW